MEVNCSLPYFDTLSNEECQMILDYAEVDDLKILRLVCTKMYNNATTVLQRNLYPLEIDMENEEHVDNFIIVMNDSKHLPFQDLRVRIFAETCPLQSVERFLGHYGKYIVECKFSKRARCWDREETLSGLYSNIKALLLKASTLKRLDFESYLYLGFDTLIEFPENVQIIGFWYEHGSCEDYRHNQQLIMSSMNVHSDTILKLHLSCLTCLVSIINKSVLKGFKQIILAGNTYISLNNINQFEAFRALNSPIVLLKMTIDINHEMTFLNRVKSLVLNEKELQILDITRVTLPYPLCNWVIPKLPQLVELNVLSLTNYSLTLTSQDLQRLKKLSISYTCHDPLLTTPIYFCGTFEALRYLVVSAALFELASPLPWTCLPNIQNLKIIATCLSRRGTTISNMFKIPSNFICVRTLEIKLGGIKVHKPAEWKRWTGTSFWPRDICTFSIDSNSLKSSTVGFTNLHGLKNVQISGLDSTMYIIWIKIIIFLTKTNQLPPLEKIVFEPNSNAAVTQVPKDYYSTLLEYHRCVKMLKCEFFNDSATSKNRL